MLVILFIITLFRGNGTQPSVVNVKKCMPADNGLFAALIICAILEAALGGYWIHKETITKKELEYSFIKGDFIMNAPRFAILTFLGLLGGFISGGFGIGPAFILNPALTQLDVFPPVASDTGMFVTTFGTITSTIIVIIFGKLNLVYTGILILMIIPGSYIGIRL